MLYFWLHSASQVKFQIDSFYMARKSDVNFQDSLHQRRHREEYWQLLSQWDWRQDYAENFYGMCADNDWPATLIPDLQLFFVKEQNGLYFLGKNLNGNVSWLTYGSTADGVQKMVVDFPCSLSAFMRNSNSLEFRRKTLHLTVFTGENEQSLLLELGLPSGRSILGSTHGNGVTVVLFSDEHGYEVVTTKPIVSDLVLDLTARILSFPLLQFSAPWYLVEEKMTSARRNLVQLLTESNIPSPIAMVDQFLDQGGWL